MKALLRWLLSFIMVSAGVMHFADPEPFVSIVPAALPAPLALVYISGAAEVAIGLGLQLPTTRRIAAWGLVALLIAVFPANINMAIHELPMGDDPLPTWALWARLPLQLVLIYWAWVYTRRDEGGEYELRQARPEPSAPS
jgi:uncharacterized membrane protein